MIGTQAGGSKRNIAPHPSSELDGRRACSQVCINIVWPHNMAQLSSTSPSASVHGIPKG